MNIRGTKGDEGAPDAILLRDLVASGVLSPDDRDRILARWQDEGGFVTDALLRDGCLGEVQLLRHFATKYATRFVPAAKLSGAAIAEETLAKIPVRVAESEGVLPLWWDPVRLALSVIVAVPFNPGRLSHLKRMTGAQSFDFYVSTGSAVRAAVRRHYYADKQAFERLDEHGAAPPPRRLTATPEERADRERTRVLYASDLDMVVTLRRENARFRIAQELHRRLPPRRDVESQLEAILELVHDLLSADTAVIELVSGKRAWKSRLPDADGAIPRSLLEEALAAPEGLLRNGIGLDGRLPSESIALRGVKSALVMPLRSGEEVLGVLYLESLSAPAAFDENDRALLSAVAANAAAVIHNAELLVQVRKEAEVRTNLSRFLAPELVDRAVEGALELQMEGQQAVVTVLYADIRGFTRATEESGAREIVGVLTRFYDEMTQAVFDEAGMIDKFMGDCVMAVWGAPIPRRDHALRAVRAARDMQRRAEGLTVNGRPLPIGIGIATGPAVMGAIGSSRRLDYTVIGPAVNVAARLCDLAGAGEVVLTGDTRAVAGPDLVAERLPPRPLKGVSGDVVLYRLGPAPHG